jgi:hypothetical protein
MYNHVVVVNAVSVLAIAGPYHTLCTHDSAYDALVPWRAARRHPRAMVLAVHHRIYGFQQVGVNRLEARYGVKYKYVVDSD